MQYPIVERLRNLMGNASRENMRGYELLASDAIEHILKLEHEQRETLRAVLHHFGPEGCDRVISCRTKST